MLDHWYARLVIIIVEKVVWYDEADTIWMIESVIPTNKTSDGQYDFTNLKPRKETVFINADDNGQGGSRETQQTGYYKLGIPTIQLDRHIIHFVYRNFTPKPR